MESTKNQKDFMIIYICFRHIQYFVIKYKKQQCKDASPINIYIC